MRRSGIQRVRVVVEKVSSVRLAQGGFVPEMKERFVPRMVLSIRVPGRVIPVVRDSLAAENIRNVIVKAAINGVMVLVKKNPVPLLTNILVRVQVIPVAQVLSVVENILNVRVPADMSGAVRLVLKKPVLRLINISVPVQVMPVVQAQLATENMPNARVPSAMSGKMVAVNLFSPV